MRVTYSIVVLSFLGCCAYFSFILVFSFFLFGTCEAELWAIVLKNSKFKPLPFALLLFPMTDDHKVAVVFAEESPPHWIDHGRTVTGCICCAGCPPARLFGHQDGHELRLFDWIRRNRFGLYFTAFILLVLFATIAILLWGHKLDYLFSCCSDKEQWESSTRKSGRKSGRRSSKRRSRSNKSSKRSKKSKKEASSRKNKPTGKSSKKSRKTKGGDPRNSTKKEVSMKKTKKKTKTKTKTPAASKTTSSKSKK